MKKKIECSGFWKYLDDLQLKERYRGTSYATDEAYVMRH